MTEPSSRRLVTEDVFLNAEGRQSARTAALEAAAGFPAPPLAYEDDVITSLAGVTTSKLRQLLDRVFQPRKQSGVLSGREPGHFALDTGAGPAATFRYEDESQHEGSLLNLYHRGAGVEGSQAYGVNIANLPNAKSAFVIHQYSRNGAMVRLDNTDVNAAIQVFNTENQTMNPGNTGTGDFLDFKPWGESKRLRLTDALTWINQTAKSVLFETATAAAYGLGVRVTNNIPALSVQKNGTGTGAGVAVTNDGISPGIDVLQNGAGLGLRVQAGAASVGSYLAQIIGKTYGAGISTDLDGGTVLNVSKKGTGSGTAITVINAGTGNSLAVNDGAGALLSRIGAAGEYENAKAGAGIVLKSPNGTRYRIAVNDAGAVTATALS